MLMLVDRVRLFIEDLFINEPSYFLVDIKYSGDNAKYKKLKITVDGDYGVDIDKCASISRNLARWLEVEDKIKTAYQLEVTSPGIDFPLTRLRQFIKNIGKKVQITTVDGEIVVGALNGVNKELLQIELFKRKRGKQVKKEEIGSATTIERNRKEINFKQVKLGKVLVDF